MRRRRPTREPSPVVWAILLAACLGFILQACDAALDDRGDKVLLWFLGAMVAFGLARLIERYKPSGSR